MFYIRIFIKQYSSFYVKNKTAVMSQEVEEAIVTKVDQPEAEGAGIFLSYLLLFLFNLVLLIPFFFQK